MTMPSSLRLKSKTTKPENTSIPSTLKLKEKQKQNIPFEGESEEETQRNIERSSARTLSRVGETVLGAPGDIASFFSGLFGKEQNLIPTSQKFKNLSEKSTLGYTSPKNEFEEKGDELISDIASMAIPGAGKYNFIRNIGIPVVGNLVKEGLKYKNSSEKTASYSKVGTLVALDLLSRNSGGVKKYAGSLFQKAEESLPKGLSIDATGLEKSLNKLEKTFSAGGSRPTTKKALEKVSEIKKEIKNGKIDAKRLAAYRPSINEAIDELGGFQIEVPKKLKPQAIKNLNHVKSEAIKTLEKYGENFNPEFLKYSRDANEAWAAYSQSNKIANFLQNHVPYSPKSKAVQALFSYAPTAAVGGLAKLSPMTATGAAAGVAGYNAFKVMDRMRRSPVLRKYYLNVLKESAAENIPQATKNLKALDTLMDQNQEE